MTTSYPTYSVATVASSTSNANSSTSQLADYPIPMMMMELQPRKEKKPVLPKVAFSVQLITVVLMLIWFFALRNIALLPMAPLPLVAAIERARDIASGRGSGTQNNLLFEATQMLGGLNKLILEIEGSTIDGKEELQTNDYNSILSANFATDVTLTIIVVLSCIALSPSINCIYLKALSPAFLIGIAIALLGKIIPLVMIIIAYFVASSHHDNIGGNVKDVYGHLLLALVVNRIVKLAVLVLLVIFLIATAIIGIVSYASELTSWAEDGKRGMALKAKNASMDNNNNLSVVTAIPNNPVFDANQNNPRMLDGNQNNPLFDGNQNNPLFDGNQNNPLFDGNQNNPRMSDRNQNNPVFDAKPGTRAPSKTAIPEVPATVQSTEGETYANLEGFK